MIIKKELKEYISKNIFPKYDENDLAHDINHIFYVIGRSLKFAKEVPNINYDMVYTIAAYHDVGHSIDAKNHEKISGDILYNDKNLRRFFSKEEISTMRDAVYDHRASLEGEPRSIYGKIVSSADRNTFIDSPLKRTYQYRLVHSHGASIDDTIEESRKHLISKFGKEGYAKEKMYFKDDDYIKFLTDLSELIYDEEKFREKFIEVNGIKVLKR